MPDELEQLHADALAEVVARLKASPSVAALVPEQVFGPDADSLAGAAEWARAVLVRPGKSHGSKPQQAGRPPLLCQRDAIIEMRAESQELLDLLAVTVVRCLNGAVSKVGFQHCIHTHSNPAADGPGDPPEYVTRTDVFGLHCVQKADAAVQAMAAPPARVTKSPAPAAARLKLKKEGE